MITRTGMLVQHTYDAKAQEEEARIQTILFDLQGQGHFSRSRSFFHNGCLIWILGSNPEICFDLKGQGQIFGSN